jgi:hypothetical protein
MEQQDLDTLPEWFLDHTFLANTFKIGEIVKQDMCEACVETWNPRKWILPSPLSGPDGVLLGEIVVTSGEKLSTNPSVSTAEVEKNYRKSSIQGLYEHNTKDKEKIDQNTAKRNRILQSFQKKKIKGLLRIHLILPEPATSEKNSDVVFSRGIRTQLNEELGVNEVIVDIDRTNIKDSNLFSTKACEFLLDRFSREKKRVGRPIGSKTKKKPKKEDIDIE